MLIGGSTVSLVGNSVLSISDFQLASGTLGGEKSLTTNGASSWESGTLTGSGTGLALDGSGVLTIGTAAIKSFSGQVSNAGAIVWTEGQVRSGASGSTFTNTGTIDLQGDGASFSTLFTGSVVNEVAGTLSRTVGTGTATISLPVTNTGTVDVDTGTLQLTGTFELNERELRTIP